jgi:MFS family permease
MTSDRPRAIPGKVILLGLVSFLTDVSSEMIFAVLPIFLVDVLGGSTVLLGLMEGLADFAASSLDLASGYLADRTGRKKALTLVGYGFSSVSKLILLFATTAPQVAVFRVVERLGKSVRGPPRDALLAAAASEARRGLAFGFHKALDKAGAIAGPLIAFAILAGQSPSLSRFRLLFTIAVVPAFAAVTVLALGMREPRVASAGRPPIAATLRRAGRPYRHYLVSVGLFSLGYSSFAFLLLKANAVGFAAGDVALLYAVVNGSFTIISTPIGKLGDRLGRRNLIALSYLLYFATMVGLAFAQSKGWVVFLFVLYGAFYAIDEGQTKAFVCDLVPSEARATGIGIYGLVTGALYLPASLIGGWLWKVGGPSATFGFAAAVALIALAYFLLALPPAAATSTARGQPTGP